MLAHIAQTSAAANTEHSTLAHTITSRLETLELGVT